MKTALSIGQVFEDAKAPDSRYQVTAPATRIALGGLFTTAGQALDFAMMVQSGVLRQFDEYEGKPLEITRVSYAAQYQRISVVEPA